MQIVNMGRPRIDKGWLLVVITVAIAYISVFAYVHVGHVVFRYVGNNYTITYIRYPELLQPFGSLFFDPPTIFPMITVNVRNLPNNRVGTVSIYLSAPTTNGFIDLGTYAINESLSKHSVSLLIDLSNYVEPAIELIKQLHNNPANSGPSVLAFITTIVNDSGRLYAVTDAITIPVILGLAEGSVVTVNVNFTPQIISQVHIINTTSKQDPSPPSTIQGSCTWIYPRPVKICTTWKETNTIANSSNAPLPILITYIGPSNVYPYSANYIDDIGMIVNIVVYTSSSSSFGFDMSLVVPTRSGKPFIEVPGPSYSWSVNSSYSQTQLAYDCGFYDSINIPNTPSSCYYSGGKYLTQLPAFGSNGGLMAISIYGTEYILNYTEYECSYLWGIISLGCQAINYSYLAWFAPNSVPNGQWAAGGFIDTNPAAQGTWLSKLVYTLFNSGAVKYVALSSQVGPSDTYTISTNNVYSSAGSSYGFAFGMPAIAICYLLGIGCPPQTEYLIIGVYAQSSSSMTPFYQFYSLISTTDTLPNTYFCYPGYYVYVQPLNNYYSAPMIIVEPNPAPSCLSHPIHLIRPINSTK